MVIHKLFRRLNIVQWFKVQYNCSSRVPNADPLKDESLRNILHSKVIYNSEVPIVKWWRRKDLFKPTKSRSNRPVTLSIVNREDKIDNKNSYGHSELDKYPDAILPLEKFHSVDMQINTSSLDCETPEPVFSAEEYLSEKEIKRSGKWMTDYEFYYLEDEKDEDNSSEYTVNYGTPDLTIPVSKVPCGGCGALLQCQEPSLPGYLPSEIFCECSSDNLQGLICQRCHFLKTYNTALSVQVDPSSYESLLSQMKDNALVLLMIDLTDFPCSIWPNIVDVIGRRRPIFVVGNKVDLLWPDQKYMIKHVETLLKESFPSYANILDVSLISAKTGYGIENLITKLHTIWRYRGSVYVIGCTNVGKSTLFNALLSSDFCKSKAVDLIQRATTSPWPKTTLNLLKFPILRPAGWRLFLRNKRLSEQKELLKKEKELTRISSYSVKKRTAPVQLIGHIAHSFKHNEVDENDADTFSLSHKTSNIVENKISLTDKDFPEFKNSHWFYDTPGVMHSDQILNLLTTEELILTVPKTMIKPITYRMIPRYSIMIAGIARLDFIEGVSPIRVTVFCSKNLPVTVCRLDDADEVYHSLLNTKYMKVPSGSKSRMEIWPGLKAGSDIVVSGISENESCADVVLSNAGWISLTPSKENICKFTPWTPHARGIHLRYPSLLPFAVRLRSGKIKNSPLYGPTKPYLSVKI